MSDTKDEKKNPVANIATTTTATTTTTSGGVGRGRGRNRKNKSFSALPASAFASPTNPAPRPVAMTPSPGPALDSVVIAPPRQYNTSETGAGDDDEDDEDDEGDYYQEYHFFGFSFTSEELQSLGAALELKDDEIFSKDLCACLIKRCLNGPWSGKNDMDALFKIHFGEGARKVPVAAMKPICRRIAQMLPPGLSRKYPNGYWPDGIPEWQTTEQSKIGGP